MARIDWRSVLGQGAVIVASILLAFSIDAGWDARRERETERALLIALSSDFDAAAAELERVELWHTSAFSAAQRLIAMGVDGSVPPDSAMAVDSLLVSLLMGASFDAPSGTLDALLGSGALDALQNHELVTALTAWASLVEDLKEGEDHGLENGFDLLRYLNTRINTLHLPLTGSLAASVTRPQPTGGYRLLAEVEFLNLLRHRALTYSLVVGDLEKVRASLLSIQAILEDERAR